MYKLLLAISLITSVVSADILKIGGTSLKMDYVETDS